MRGVFLLLVCSSVISACGSESIPPAAFFSGDGIQEFSLVAVDGSLVPESDSVVLQLVNETQDLPQGIPDCSGTVAAQPMGASLKLLRNGLSESGCFVDVASNSNHVRVVAAIQAGATLEYDGVQLLIRSTSGLYEFQPQH